MLLINNVPVAQIAHVVPNMPLAIAPNALITVLLARAKTANVISVKNANAIAERIVPIATMPTVLAQTATTPSKILL